VHQFADITHINQSIAEPLKSTLPSMELLCIVELQMLIQVVYTSYRMRTAAAAVQHKHVGNHIYYTKMYL